MAQITIDKPGETVYLRLNYLLLGSFSHGLVFMGLSSKVGFLMGLHFLKQSISTLGL